ncbi:hypothetical protein FBEOM_13065 [Fusarium beomiforme]|uniref:Uncharacterized protein n=1 Tax=Fusarium beomiforme TaxID=44412 RepID=A0A9P5DNI4_9HYPO|nr:hypothetical protein FBEOM_13065 [Fusarium beomiforme]
MADMRTVSPEPLMEPSDEAPNEINGSTKELHAVGKFSVSRKILKPVRKFDAFISHLNRLMHTRESHDALILFLAYAAHFLATALETPLPKSLQICMAKAGDLIKRILPGRLLSVLSISKSSPFLAALPGYRIVLAERARALSDILDDWQIITRLWGLFATWAEAKDFINSFNAAEPDIDKSEKGKRRYFLQKAIRASYIVGLFGYYGTENLAWLARRGVLKWSAKTESKLMLWSLKSWGVYVISELAQLLYDRSENKRIGKEQDQETRTQWRRRFTQMLLYGPLTVHWIRDGTVFPETIASFLAAYTEFLTVQGLWKDAAEPDEQDVRV